ncbi:RodZ family helix-turn-helix domain-containing protein [Holospora undulata]|uniref:Uncharacterized protein n=1 Tax=Holospora undulata HU1 TaxID=1321371 RepID=A0A061JFU0_9PROT|nr:hypothetical protein [Holospora undulata]ETZ04535.1 hypothetical protein K737_301051 [Holospora undulata HU1]
MKKYVLILCLFNFSAYGVDFSDPASVPNNGASLVPAAGGTTPAPVNPAAGGTTPAPVNPAAGGTTPAQNPVPVITNGPTSVVDASQVVDNANEENTPVTVDDIINKTSDKVSDKGGSKISEGGVKPASVSSIQNTLNSLKTNSLSIPSIAPVSTTGVTGLSSLTSSLSLPSTLSSPSLALSSPKISSMPSSSENKNKVTISAPPSSDAYLPPVAVYCEDGAQMGLLAIQKNALNASIPSKAKGTPVLENTEKTPVPQGQLALSNLKNLCNTKKGVNIERLKKDLEKHKYSISAVKKIK